MKGKTRISPPRHNIIEDYRHQQPATRNPSHSVIDQRQHETENLITLPLNCIAMGGLQQIRHIGSIAPFSGRLGRSQRFMSTFLASGPSQIPQRTASFQLRAFRELTDAKRHLSSITRGQDLLEDSLSHGARRKIILDSYGPSGFDVKGMLRVGDEPENDERPGDEVIVHLNGSIVAFPHACFLWKVKSPKEVTLESLSVVKLYKPTVE